MRPKAILHDYLNLVKALIYTNEHIANRPKIGFKLHKGHGSRKALVSVERIEFVDGSIFELKETVEVTDRGAVIHTAYKYQYERPDGYYFRYDRSLKGVKQYIHEECHLHVCSEEPRYITHATNFEEVFRFVEESFYNA